MAAVRDGHYLVPPPVRGVGLTEALSRMRAVLLANGSAALRASLATADATAVLAACERAVTLHDIFDALGTAPAARDMRD
jgi:hypothetical protein